MKALQEYPALIAQASRALLTHRQKMRPWEESIATYDAEIEQQIANDPDLRNDSQRKAKRADLQAAEDYKALLIDLNKLRDLRTELDIQLQQIENEFACKKLLIQHAIANANRKI